MRVLITGASGFVGSTLCDHLTRRGAQIKALMRNSSSRAHLVHSKFTPISGDLRNSESLENAVKDVDYVFHLAGVVAANSKEEYLASNGSGTANLLAAVKKFNPELKRFIYVSSLAAQGPSHLDKANSEADPCRPVSYYGQSKLAGEEAVRSSGLASLILRPPAVYGPRDQGMFTFFKLIKSGLNLKLGGNRPSNYSFVHVEDLVDGILLAADQEAKLAKQELFFIAGDQDASWDQAMEFMSRALNVKPLNIGIPMPILSALGLVYTGVSKVSGKALPLNLDKVKELRESAWTCSNQKAKNILGFKPRWDLAQGLEQTARWYQEHSWF